MWVAAMPAQAVNGDRPRQSFWWREIDKREIRETAMGPLYDVIL